MYGIFTYIYHKKSTIHVDNIPVPWVPWYGMGPIELHTSLLPLSRLSLFEVTNEVLPEQLEKLRQKAQEVRNASENGGFFPGESGLWFDCVLRYSWSRPVSVILTMSMMLMYGLIDIVIEQNISWIPFWRCSHRHAVTGLAPRRTKRRVVDSPARSRIAACCAVRTP